MNERDIDWNKVTKLEDGKTCKRSSKILDEFKDKPISFNLEFEVLKYTHNENEEWYQLNASLPFAFKSSWIKTNHGDSCSNWIKYAEERLESKLKEKYDALKKRNDKNLKYFKLFQEATEITDDEEAKKEYISCFNHGSLDEEINCKKIGIIINELAEKTKKPDETEENSNNDSKPDKTKIDTMILEGKCSYCGISIEQINILSKKRQLFTKRARGYSMEIDQKDAYGFYTDENCVPSCYWCNNAKTDEFTVEEFKKIAYGINQVWNMRFAEIELEERVIFPENSDIWCK